MELEKILEKLDRMKEDNGQAEKTDEQRAKEIEQQSQEQQQNADLEVSNEDNSQNNNNKNQNSENKEQSADNGNGLPEFFKDFEGKAQVSPDDIKAILSDPTKGQQLIDWIKTQNKIVKEVPGLQNVMKQAQSQPKNNETEGGTDKSTTDGGAKQLRPFQDYLEPLGKIMKTQADCDQAIQFFTNLKHTKPAAPANNSASSEQNETQSTEGSTETVQNQQSVKNKLQ